MTAEDFSALMAEINGVNRELAQQRDAMRARTLQGLKVQLGKTSDPKLKERMRQVLSGELELDDFYRTEEFQAGLEARMTELQQAADEAVALDPAELERQIAAGQASLHVQYDDVASQEQAQQQHGTPASDDAPPGWRPVPESD